MYPFLALMHFYAFYVLYFHLIYIHKALCATFLTKGVIQIRLLSSDQRGNRKWLCVYQCSLADCWPLCFDQALVCCCPVQWTRGCPVTCRRWNSKMGIKVRCMWMIVKSCVCYGSYAPIAHTQKKHQVKKHNRRNVYRIKEKQKLKRYRLWQTQGI